VNVSKHLKIAGYLQIVQGLFDSVFSILYIIILIRELQEGSPAFDGRMLSFAFTLLVGVCLLWFGISLVMQKRWTTRVWGFIFCAPGLIAFPVGTAISGYALWVVIRGEDAKVTEPAI
jgi:hypothetical protein